MCNQGCEMTMVIFESNNSWFASVALHYINKKNHLPLHKVLELLLRTSGHLFLLFRKSVHTLTTVRTMQRYFISSENITFFHCSIAHLTSSCEKRSLSLRWPTGNYGTRDGRKAPNSVSTNFLLPSVSLTGTFRTSWSWLRASAAVVIRFLRTLAIRNWSSRAAVHLFLSWPGLRS